MQYEVLKSFYDKEDNLQPYGIGGKYPKSEVKPSKDRIQLLMDLGYIKGGENGRDNDDVDLATDSDDGDRVVGSVSEANTKKEIVEYLEKTGIEFNKSDTKKELLDLLVDSHGKQN